MTVNVIPVHRPSRMVIGSKELLQEALALDPESVLFLRTSLTEEADIRGDDIPEGCVLRVVGLTDDDCRWEAVVEVADGEVSVS